MEEIELQSGLALKKPEWMIKKFVDDEYPYWDGPPANAACVQQDSTITLFDILFSMLINWNIHRNGVWNFWQVHEAVDQALNMIPEDMPLTASDVPWDALEALLQSCMVPYVKLATATKVLHKKRPKLIPILDSVLQDYYCTETSPAPPYGLKVWEKGLWVMKKFRDDLVACQSQIAVLCSALEDQDTPLTPVRVLDALIWMEKENTGHYREWRDDCLAVGDCGEVREDEWVVSQESASGPRGPRAVVGSQRDNPLYHHPECPYAKMIIENGHAIWFDSPEQAQRSGRKAAQCDFCRECLPSLQA